MYRFQDKCVYVLYAEIQDGQQKWRENDLWEMSPVDSADTLEGQKFRRNCSITHCFRENTFLLLCRNSRWPPKRRQNNFWEKSPVDSADTLPGGKKFQPNHCISHCFPDKCIFTFYAEIQDGSQKWQENNFWEKLAN